MPDLWGVAAILAKLLLYVGVMGAGGLLLMRCVFAALLQPNWGQIRARTMGFAALTFVAAMAGFLLNAAALTGGIDGMYDPEMLGLLWHMHVGDVLVLRLTGAALIFGALLVPRVGHWIALPGAALMLWSFTQIGHVPALAQFGPRLLLLAHLVGAAFWIGVLGPLRTLARRPEHLDRAATLGHRFGVAAMVIVPGLILAGLAMAWLLLGDVRALVTTGYGINLLIKLALVAAVLVLATVNKQRFIPAMRAGNARAAQHLVRSIEIESGVILLVLAATATLTSVMTLPG